MQLLEAMHTYEQWQSLRKKTTTLGVYAGDVRNFCIYANPDEQVGSVSIESIMKFLENTLSVGWDRNTVRRKSVALRQFFRFCELRKIPHSFDYRLIPVPELEYRAPRATDWATYKKLLDTFQGDDRRTIRNRAMARIFWDSMARIGEVLSINVDDLDFDRRCAVIKTEKSRGRKPVRQIFWPKDNDETQNALKEWVEKRKEYSSWGNFDDKALFISLSGEKRGQRLHPNGVRTVFREHSQQAGIVPHINPHAMRHAGGIEMALGGVNNSTISSILGHANINSSFIYTRLTDNVLETAYRGQRG